jgi:hypothetical protein
LMSLSSKLSRHFLSFMSGKLPLMGVFRVDKWWSRAYNLLRLGGFRPCMEIEVKTKSFQNVLHRIR